MSTASIPVPGWRRYTEQVEQVEGSGRYTILLREHPLYLQGYAPVRHQRRFGNFIVAPRVPLYQLGAERLGALGQGVATSAIQTGSQIAAQSSKAQGTVSIIGGSISASFKGFASGGPVGAVIAGVASLITGFWSAHNARVAGAKAENQIVNSAVIAFDQSLKAIFSAANASDSTQALDPATAAQQCQALYATWWQAVAPYTHGAGEADASGGGATCSILAAKQATHNQCGKSCTAGCCVGCMDVYPAIQAAVAVFQAGGGTMQVPTVFSSKYGVKQRAGYSLTYSPASIAGSAASILSALTGGSSGSSLLPIALLAIGAFLVLR